MQIKNMLIALGRQLEDENNAANDLWSWLPSHQVATELWGDYAIEQMPQSDEVMNEAACMLAALRDYMGEDAFNRVRGKLAEVVREEGWIEAPEADE